MFGVWNIMGDFFLQLAFECISISSLESSCTVLFEFSRVKHIYIMHAVKITTCFLAAFFRSWTEMSTYLAKVNYCSRIVFGKTRNLYIIIYIDWSLASEQQQIVFCHNYSIWSMFKSRVPFFSRYFPEFQKYQTEWFVRYCFYGRTAYKQVLL